MWIGVLSHRLPLGDRERDWEGLYKSLLENEWESISKDELCKVMFAYSKIKQAVSKTENISCKPHYSDHGIQNVFYASSSFL